MLQTNFHCNWPCGSGEKIFEGLIVVIGFDMEVQPLITHNTA